MIAQAKSPRILSPAEAAALVGTRDTVGMGLGPAIPDGILRALGTRDDWDDLVVGGALLLDFYELFTRRGVSFRSGFFGPAERLLESMGHRVELVPGGFRQFAPILERFAPRVMLTQGVLASEDGPVSLSLHYGATKGELLRAGRDPDRLLIVEVNRNLPVTRSLPPEFDNTLPLEIVDALVEASGPPFELADPVPDDVDRAIAGHALRYIENAATLQIGIGSVPNVVADALACGDGGDFGVHSEMFTTGLMRLHQAGKVSNRNKGLFAGKSVTTFALGTEELYRWLHENDKVAFVDVATLNDPHTIGRNARFISINGALSVDLFGQIVADRIGGHQVSGVGGHEDFVAGAEMHSDAHSLICMHSTAESQGELVSRIVDVLPRGSVVSTPRHHTGVVITEYGAAELMGLTVRERAMALAEIAHPAFRNDLQAAARGI